MKTNNKNVIISNTVLQEGNYKTKAEETNEINEQI